MEKVSTIVFNMNYSSSPHVKNLPPDPDPGSGYIILLAHSDSPIENGVFISKKNIKTQNLHQPILNLINDLIQLFQEQRK